MFLKLTDESSMSAYLNFDHVLTFIPHSYGSQVYTMIQGMDSLIFKETPEEIMSMLHICVVSNDLSSEYSYYD